MKALSYGILKSRIQNIGSKYKEYREVFSTFLDLVDELNSEEFHVLGITIEDHREQDYLDVRFAGRCFRFALELGWKDEMARGEISCYEVISPELYNKLILIDKIPINRYGDIDIVPPESDDNLCCQSRGGAWYLIFHGIYKGFSEQGMTRETV